MGEVLGLIKLHGVNGEGKFALVSIEDLDHISQYTWFVSHGYAYATISGEHCYPMHRLIMGLSRRQSEEYEEVDHINYNTLDNTRSNLRIVNRSQNACNQPKLKTMKGRPTTSSFKGVHWNKKSGKWHCQIKKHGKAHHLGCFDDEVEAARAYDQASRELHGQNGKRNFPDPPIQVINIYNYYSGPPQTQ